MIGRYSNYPGYSYNPSSGFTVDQEVPDYPTSGPFRYQRASQMYFNHVWSQIALRWTI